MARNRFWFRFLSSGALGILILGAFSLIFSDRGNYCEMTFMYEYPKFVHIKVPGNEMYPQYSLYSYSEGRLTEKARKMRFDGIPVLYLPGNSGSRSQARSLASVALRMGLSDEYSNHFDFFTINFNEDLSGLYGGVLEMQTKFTSHALRRILNLYKVNRYTKSIPNSVILIGHSMGGVITKRLLMYGDSQNATFLAITLAAPVAAPILNLDIETDKYYLTMHREWAESLTRDKKVLLSFGSGPRDLMVPSSLVTSENSDFSALMTSIPGVWVSPDHLSIVWCRQFMIRFNRFLFSIVDGNTSQMVNDKQFILDKAVSFFQANRSMYLDNNMERSTTLVTQDAFWYEDNRRIFQITRPSITRMTYLMIRLVGTHTDRFVAIETVDSDDKEWLFGCSAIQTYNNQRTCKDATSLSELTRWTAAAKGFGLRNLATVHLHDVMMKRPDWTHIIVKRSPTRRPVLINVDINDYASRNITVDLPSVFSFGRTVIKERTEPNSLYYELLLPDMTQIYDTYLLYVEPSEICPTEYHVSAELHIPWARNNDYYHFFTSNSKKPMKLRLFNTNPNILNGTEVHEHAKITVLLDPKCTFSISIESTRYHSIGQMLRQYFPILFPYMAAILLLAARSSLQSVMETGYCEPMHTSLASDSLRPYYVVVFGRLGTMIITSVPVLTYVLDNAGLHNVELLYFTRSLLSIPLYMAALGILNLLAVAILVTALFCSQLAHKLLFKIIFRGGGGTIAEKMAGVIQKAPLLISAALVLNVPASCGAASLAAGGAFYFFMLSKMYEEYLEDYAYKLLAKLGTKIRKYFKMKKSKETEQISESTALLPKNSEPKYIVENTKINDEIKAIEDSTIKSIADINCDNDDLKIKQKFILGKIKDEAKINEGDPTEKLMLKLDKSEFNDRSENTKGVTDIKQIAIKCNVDVNNKFVNINGVSSENEQENKTHENAHKSETTNTDDDLNGINFHFIMFFLWMVVACVNMPVLLTWARNFKFTMILTPDTSFYPGFVMSVCAGFLWQMSAPRGNLKHYNTVCQILYILSIIVLVMGPLAGYYINYAVTAAFVIITLQQLFDTELQSRTNEANSDYNSESDRKCEPEQSTDEAGTSNVTDTTEDQIYDTIKKMKEKVDSNDLGSM